MGLVSAGYQVWTASPTDDYLPQLELVTGTVHHPLHAMNPKGQSGNQELSCLREIYALYQLLRPTLVVHFTIKPNVYGGLAARQLGLPYLAIITGLGYPFLHDGWRNRIVPYLYKVALRRAKRVVFYNSADAGHFLDHRLIRPEQLARINGSGVDSTHFFVQPVPELSNDGLRLLYVGRILRDKGIMELLEATQQALQEGINIRLTLLGDLNALNPEVMEQGDFLNFIEAINVASSQVFGRTPNAPRVQFIDAVDDVRPWLASHHVFVLPSYREGLSRAGVEALCSGRPILTTDVPGCRELVSGNQVNGLLVDARSATALKNAIQQLTELNWSDLQRMGHHSRQLAEAHFSAEATTAAFLDLVQRIVRT